MTSDSPLTVFRANAQRTGTLARPALPRLTRLQWTFATGGNVFSTPAVSGGLAYFGSRDRHLYAVEVATGRERWRLVTGRGISASPAIAGDTVYITSEDGYLYAVDLASGGERWRLDLGLPSASSPAIDGETLYVGSGGTRPHLPGGHLHAVALEGGFERWRLRADAGFPGSSAVAGARVYCGNRAGCLYAVDAASGAVVWTHDSEKEIVAAPAVAGDTVFFSGGSTLYALDAGSGQLRW